MKSILRKKKGDMPSLIIGLIIILFAVGVSAILFSKIFLSVTEELKKQPEFSNNTKETIESVETKTVPFLDYLFFFSFVAILIGLIISSIYIDVHPALTIIFVIILIVAIILAGIFANAFVEIGEEDEIAGTYNQFKLTKSIVNNLPLIILISGIIVILILYGKSRSYGMGV